MPNIVMRNRGKFSCVSRPNCRCPAPRSECKAPLRGRTERHRYHNSALPPSPLITYSAAAGPKKCTTGCLSGRCLAPSISRGIDHCHDRTDVTVLSQAICLYLYRFASSLPRSLCKFGACDRKGKLARYRLKITFFVSLVLACLGTIANIVLTPLGHDFDKCS